MKSLKSAVVVAFISLGCGLPAAQANDHISKLAHSLADKFPLVAFDNDADVRSFMNAKVFPMVEKRGLRQALAATIEDILTEEEMKRLNDLYQDDLNRNLFSKIGQMNALISKLVNEEIAIALKCTAKKDRPAKLAESGEFNVAERTYYCK